MLDLFCFCRFINCDRILALYVSLKEMSSSDLEILQQTIFTAAKEGKLKQLKSCLASKTSSQVKALTSTKVEGSTPLITASREGHLEVVQFLITKCHTDLQQRGSVVFDGETIEDAPPLWCAAAAGHFNIVKCLIQHKADPNCTTQTNSTPLRAACFDGHIGIVKYLLEHKADFEIANRHGHTCLMIACYKGHTEIVKTLLEAGADVNRCSIKHNTALHDCAENGCVSIAKMLLLHHARMQKDSHGMTPLMTAAVAGHEQLSQFFSSLDDIPKIEQIHAYELLGATYLDKRHDLSNAFKFWEKALTLRQAAPEAEIPKREPIPAYGYVVEPNTQSKLQEIRSSPEKARMVALLIRERVLGPKHPDTSYFIRYRGAVFADSGNFEKCVALWMHALDMQRKNLEPLYPMTLSSLLSFAELFSFMEQNRSHMSSTVPKANADQVLSVLQRAVDEIDRGCKMVQKSSPNDKEDRSCTTKKSSRIRSIRPDMTYRNIASYSRSSPSVSSSRSLGSGMPRRPQSNHHNSSTCCSICEASNQRVYRAMVITLHLSALSEIVLHDKTTMSETATKTAVRKRNTLLYRLKSITDHCDHTLLHLASCARACPLGRYPVTRFPNANVIKVLLTCGYDPNARDCDGKTPAHLAAETSRDCKSPLAIDVLNQLLDGGAHPDFTDKSGRTVLDFLGSKLSTKINPVHRMSLQCLAATVLKQRAINYYDLLPKSLADFVKAH
ncbi:unnamed protein product [Clavelina lepadiformis]|uniref:Protein fem-1 homolog C n=1 Tax=Clavelina lepadiformis TaxID=159417 RepID=A0ABP0FAG4_CLALP